jgi:hypothetical protein
MFAKSLFKPYRRLLLEPLYFGQWWYKEVLGNIVFFALFLLARVEDTFSFFVMLKQLITLQPLHQDFSIVGRGIGVVLRFFWLTGGLVGLSVVLVFDLVLILGWILLPLWMLVEFGLCVQAAL